MPLEKDKPDYLSTHPRLGKFRDPDTNCGNLAVDIGVYDSDDIPEGRTTDHSLMETQTELKAHANYDAFVDLEDNQKSPAAEENGEDDEDEEEYEVEEEETEDEAEEEEEAAEEEPKVDEVVPEDVEVLPDFPFENGSIKGRETRGQISCYAGVTMMLQHRSHLFHDSHLWTLRSIHTLGSIWCDCQQAVRLYRGKDLNLQLLQAFRPVIAEPAG